jgi:prepilin-type N-terminal cleavage/methylation domain-containing protein
MRLIKAFTLIEILVSVILISVVVLGILKIRSRNVDLMHYISKRLEGELSNSLFLGEEALKYNGDEKSALDLLRRMNVDNLTSRKILERQKRHIYVSDPLRLEVGSPVQIRSIILKGAFSAKYYRVSYGSGD